VHRALDAEGRTLRIVHNWSWQPAALPLPVDGTDLVGGHLLPAGTALELGPWDVRVVRERG